MSTTIIGSSLNSKQTILFSELIARLF